MKKTIIVLSIIVAGYYSQAQNTIVDPKGTPTSNKDLPSNNPGLGSNSGVNPAGSPGTITGNTGNSNSINNQTTPNPNIEKGVFLNSSPGGTVYSNPVPAGSNVQSSTSAVGTNGGTITVNEIKTDTVAALPVATTTVPPSNPPVVKKRSLPSTTPVAKAGIKTKTKKENTAKNTTAVKEKAVPAYSPLLSNYISQEVINKIKTKYGPSVYDIKTVRVVKNNKLAYLVRISENGTFRNELYYDEP
ncbi:MAG: hypothetical protein ABI402_07255 [Ferruginibacter sp.]